MISDRWEANVSGVFVFILCGEHCKGIVGKSVRATSNWKVHIDSGIFKRFVSYLHATNRLNHSVDNFWD